MLIERDGGLRNLRHSCKFDYEQRVLKHFLVIAISAPRIWWFECGTMAFTDKCVYIYLLLYIYSKYSNSHANISFNIIEMPSSASSWMINYFILILIWKLFSRTKKSGKNLKEFFSLSSSLSTKNQIVVSISKCNKGFDINTNLIVVPW